MGKEGVIAKKEKGGENEVDEDSVYEVSGFSPKSHLWWEGSLWEFQGSAPDLAFGERGPYGSFRVRSSG